MYFIRFFTCKNNNDLFKAALRSFGLKLASSLPNSDAKTSQTPPTVKLAEIETVSAQNKSVVL